MAPVLKRLLEFARSVDQRLLQVVTPSSLRGAPASSPAFAPEQEVVQAAGRGAPEAASGPNPVSDPVSNPVSDPVSDPVSNPADAPEPGVRPVCILMGSAALQDAAQPRGQVFIEHHWATWCEPCEEELPLIEGLFRQLQGRAELLGISWDRLDTHDRAEMTLEHVRNYLLAKGLTWPCAVYEGGAEALFSALELDYQRIPQTRVFGVDGKLLLHFQGPMGDEELARVLELLDEGG